MSFIPANCAATKTEFNKLLGNEKTIGKVFLDKILLHKDIKKAFSGVTDLDNQATVVVAFLVSLIDNDGADDKIKTFVASHKMKDGVTLDLIMSTKDALIETLTTNKIDKDVATKFVTCLFDTIEKKWKV